MQMTEVLMLGEQHHDENRAAKITAQLVEFQPDRILIEGADGSDRVQDAYAEALNNGLSRIKASEQVIKVMQWSLNLTSASFNPVREFTEAHDATYGFLNDKTLWPRNEAAAASSARELIRKIQNEELGFADLEKTMKDTRSKAQKVLLLIKTLNSLGQEGRVLPYRHIGARDVFMMERLKREIQAGHDRIVTITGMAHITIVPEKKSFYSLALENGIKVRREFLFD